MRILIVISSLAALCIAGYHGSPAVHDKENDVTYHGQMRNGLEVFLGIPYGEDTSGQNRFKNPQPHVPAKGSNINAQSFGPACPQRVEANSPPLVLSNQTYQSENCLNLNVVRPKGCYPESKLPVMVFIHGGSFWTGSNSEITTTPDGLVLQSIANGLPVIHVEMNYRLGVFGFAISGALRDEGNTNFGLRDQRLALEWIQQNIEHFGGDPSRVTIAGQSSGGLAIGLHILAYGGSKPVPFTQGQCESQALEPGITGNFTYHQMDLYVDYLGCNRGGLDTAETLDCLRSLDTATSLNASLETYSADISNNIGDCWLPAVDGDFLPAAPTELIAQGRFANVTTMIGWAEDDVQFFTDLTINSSAGTRNFIGSYLPGLNNETLDGLLALYPSSEFPDNPDANLSGEFYRSARIFRDLLMTCEPLLLGEALEKKGASVYYYNQNQSVLPPILASLGAPVLGPVHTSEFAYVFGNLSHYNISDYPYDPTESDYALRDAESRTWSTFASTGMPSLEGKNTLQGWMTAYTRSNETDIYVIGGPDPGLSAFDGPNSKPAVAAQKLRERCGYINDPEFVAQLNF